VHHWQAAGCTVDRSDGNPASQIYRLKKSGNHLEPLLSHLAVIVRGFGR
jgi:hypothetical protein